MPKNVKFVSVGVLNRFSALSVTENAISSVTFSALTETDDAPIPPKQSNDEELVPISPKQSNDDELVPISPKQSNDEELVSFALDADDEAWMEEIQENLSDLEDLEAVEEA